VRTILPVAVSVILVSCAWRPCPYLLWFFKAESCASLVNIYNKLHVHVSVRGYNYIFVTPCTSVLMLYRVTVTVAVGNTRWYEHNTSWYETNTSYTSLEPVSHETQAIRHLSLCPFHHCCYLCLMQPPMLPYNQWPQISIYRVFQKKLHKLYVPQFCNCTSESHVVYSKMFRKKFFTRQRTVSEYGH